MMETCLVIVGDDEQLGKSLMPEIARRIQKLMTAEHGFCVLSAVTTDVATLDAVLTQGAPFAQQYESAEARMFISTDGKSTAYLDKVAEVLEAARLNGVDADRMPSILQMRDAVALECVRRQLTRVYVQNLAGLEMDRGIAQRLCELGIESPEAEVALDESAFMETMAQLSESRDQKTSIELVNHLKIMLAQVAARLHCDNIVLDFAAWPLFRHEGLVAEWGPKLIDGWSLYLDEAARKAITLMQK